MPDHDARQEKVGPPIGVENAAFAEMMGLPRVAELILEFAHPQRVTRDGQSLAVANYRVRYRGPDSQAHEIQSDPIEFIAPLGPAELEELRWYFEEYFRWPYGPFRARAETIEQRMPLWGQTLFTAISRDSKEIFRAFFQERSTVHAPLERLITIQIDDQNANAEGKAAAAAILNLPWDLLHDGRSYLFEGVFRASIRHKLGIVQQLSAVESKKSERVRVLVVIARPEDERLSLVDPRATSASLLEALAEVGDSIDVHVLAEPTLPAFREAMGQAKKIGQPYSIVHFDGHGVYDAKRATGLLAFEHAGDLAAERRRPHYVSALEIGAILREMGVSLFVLEACQSAMAGKDARTSVVAELARQGINSVVAMRYLVLVETARKFMTAFYRSLVRGDLIGSAMVSARQTLKDSPTRLHGSRGSVDWMDWLVPLLYQSHDDVPMFSRSSESSVEHERAPTDANSAVHSELPARPQHGFFGRKRELLRIERLLLRRRRVAVLGKGGEGKTTLAVEVAHWFALTRRVERIVFVSVETITEPRALLDAVGRQLIPGYSVALADTNASEGARIRIIRELALRKTLLFIDNVESLNALAEIPQYASNATEIATLIRELASAGETYFLATSREALPSAIDGQTVRLEELDAFDARRLVVGVLTEHGIDLQNLGSTEDEVIELLDGLVQAVRGHARSIVLLGPTIVGRGLKATAQSLRREMRTLDRKYPEQRERSLLASVRLSLRRLDESTRRLISPLAVVRQTVPMQVVARLFDVDLESAEMALEPLIDLGLVGVKGDYVSPDPALGLALSLEMDTPASALAEKRWRDSLDEYAEILYRHSLKSTQIARDGTTATWVDLFAALESKAQDADRGVLDANEVMVFATNVEQLIAFVGRPRALRQVCGIRELLRRKLPSVCRGRVLAGAEEVERRLDEGDARGAETEARLLVACADSEEQNHSEVEFDRARSRIKLGRALLALPRPDEALPVFVDAEQRFSKLAARGHEEAGRMEIVALTDRGNALLAMGKYEEAAEAFEETSRRDEKRGAQRDIAVSRGRLAMTRLLQGRLDSAMTAGVDALERFKKLGESRAVAETLQMIGVIHENARQYQQAERKFKESLNIRVELGDRIGEASTLGQLAILCEKQERFDEAVNLYQQSIAILEASGSWINVFRQQTNLGILLRTRGQLDQARETLRSAGAIQKRMKFLKDSWKPWYQLMLLERQAQQPTAETLARSEVILAYTADRRANEVPVDATAALISKIGKMLAARQWLGAMVLLRNIRQQDPQSPELLTWLGILEKFVKDRENAQLPEESTLDPILVAEFRMALELLSPRSSESSATPVAPVNTNPPAKTSNANEAPVNRPSRPSGSDAPKAVVDIGIVIALQEEFRELAALCGSLTPERDELLTAYRFTRGSYQLVATFVGDMGEAHAARVTERVMSLFRPISVIVVGIAAGVHDDLKVGDVYVPAQAVQYMQDAKAVQKRGKKSDFSIVPGAPAYRADHALLDAVRNLEFQHPRIYRTFLDDCASDLQALIPNAANREKLLEQALVRNHVELLSGGHVATGPVVGAASSFGAWIRSHDRNVKALEMESAAVWLAAQSRGTPVRALAIRGISDLGDDRKQALDNVGGGALRRYAMRNAIRLLWALLDAEAWPRHSRGDNSGPTNEL